MAYLHRKFGMLESEAPYFAGLNHTLQIEPKVLGPVEKHRMSSPLPL